MTDKDNQSHYVTHIKEKFKNIFGISKDESKQDSQTGPDGFIKDEQIIDLGSIHLKDNNLVKYLGTKIKDAKIDDLNKKKENNSMDDDEYESIMSNYLKNKSIKTVDKKETKVTPEQSNASSPYYYEDISILDYDIELPAIIVFHDFIYKIILDPNNENSLYTKIRFTSKYFEFPLYYINKLKYLDDTKTIIIKLKDYRIFKLKSKDEKLYNNLKLSIIYNQMDYHQFAKFYKSTYQFDNNLINGWNLYDPIKEYNRQEVNFSMDGFRITEANKNYEICDTYPSVLIIPTFVNDSQLKEVAPCRIKNRFPVLTYFYKRNHASIFRSSQIYTGGILKKNNLKEIDYINNIDSNKDFVFFDCRPYINAKANSLKGAGVEIKEDYKNCSGVIFGNIENIHAVRRSLKNSINRIYMNWEDAHVSFNTNISNKKFYSKFEEAKWHDYLSDILNGGITVVNKILRGINVIVHCSDGWDRTSQICALVQIVLDPFYRTIEGFAILIEKDFVSFGHQFTVRCGADVRSEKKPEISPIFVQFLHLIYQLLVQFPTAFEFNENMLLFLCENVYSGQYGTFLFNSEIEIIKYQAKEKTVSIWTDILKNKKEYINPLYVKYNNILNIRYEPMYLKIWERYFFRYEKLGVINNDISYDDKWDNLEKCFKNKDKKLYEIFDIIDKNGLGEQIKDNELYKLYKNEIK